VLQAYANIEDPRLKSIVALLIKHLHACVNGMERARVVVRGANYWRAEFKTALWRFVDDVEFLFDDNARRIDIRSASRVGYSDLGVNRRRIGEIRNRFSG
jgi:uncharacterized protein (DUF1499 family)